MVKIIQIYSKKIRQDYCRIIPASDSLSMKFSAPGKKQEDYEKGVFSVTLHIKNTDG